jgi:hypothetical protein
VSGEQSTESAQIAIRHPRRGKTHLPIWGDFSVGMPWESRRPVGTACGFGDGGTVRAMTEEIAVERTDPYDRCRICFPPGQGVDS